MAGRSAARYYVTLWAKPEMLHACGSGFHRFADHCCGIVAEETKRTPEFRVASVQAGGRATAEGGSRPLVVAIEFEPSSHPGTRAAELNAIRDAFSHRAAEPAPALDGIVTESLALGVDLPIGAADCWCPGEAAAPLFGDERDALARIGFAGLGPLTGRGVNVVLMDDGLDMRGLPDANRGMVWRQRDLDGDTVLDWARLEGADAADEPAPGARDGIFRRTHAAMTARNILRIAPQAIIHDVALLPPTITDVPRFLRDAQSACAAVEAAIVESRARDPRVSWVIVNAWGVYDRRSEPKDPETGEFTYSANPDHALSILLRRADAAGIDVVFAAGNCGQFCPRSRCGPGDRGPGRSIHGVNSHPRVLTVGAVRADGMWLGYSAQGPGQRGLGTTCEDETLAGEKPDLCAPSQFVESSDAAMGNTGTSAACALAAGVVAAIRGGWDHTRLRPDRLRAILRETARRNGGGEWNGRLGHGILDAAAARAAVEAEAGPGRQAA
jgi:hypothetical protein